MKRELRFAGELDYYGGGLTDTGPRIGGVDVIQAIERMWDYRQKEPVRVFLGTEPVAEGPSWAIHGFGGTDVTPHELPEITVGGIDMLDKLECLDGREVLLIVEDA